MRARSAVLRLCVVVSSLLLAACGGGGGSSAMPAANLAPQPGNGAGSGAPASVAFTIQIPSASSSGSKRRPRYVSAGTKSASVTYGTNRQVVDCTTTCSLQMTVLPGTVTFNVGLYDASAGGGNLLASGTTTTTIVPGQQNSVNITFAGVVASIALLFGAGSVAAGTPASVPVTVTAKDAAGYTIVGSDPYGTPIALSVDGSGAASLSTSSVSSPSSAVSLNYNGSSNVSALHVSASVPGTNVAAQSPALAVQAQAPPAGSVPTHVTTYYYYGINGTNASIPASWMAAHADYVEDDGDQVAHASAFKAAGGKYAVSYTDPAYVPYCFAPFSGPQATCQGQVGKLVTDESAWFHGSDGTRTRRYVDAHFGYQEVLNPASAAAQDAYRKTTQAILANGPIDYFFADDAGGVYIGSDGTEMTGWFWGFNAPGTEITTDADFIVANKKMLAAAAKPVVLNGSTPYTMLPSYNGAWLDSPNVMAQNFEGCFSDDNGAVAGPHNNRWVYQSNALLATYAHRTNAVCMMYANPTPANRVYEMASWWITYDERYSIAAPYTSYPLKDGFTVVPEYDVVPRQPLTSPSGDVSSMRSASGAYVREFAACYQAGAPLGPCAAVVNASSSTESMPILSGRYTSSLVLDDASEYTGGKANWTGTIPTSLAPQTALVLR
ncbi:MAG: hypothetical protein JO083_00820 [Candidatus Eremiobacteraeota bacterium]|nr:hypothetical protein [Candidatus Eremiobacteraeota bacterium]